MFEMERWWKKLSNIKDSSHTWSRFVRLSWRTCCRLSFGRAERWTWAELWRTWWSAGRPKCRRSERRPELGLSSPTAAVPGTNICSISWFNNLFLGYLYLKTQYFQQVIYKIYIIQWQWILWIQWIRFQQKEWLKIDLLSKIQYFFLICVL